MNWKPYFYYRQQFTGESQSKEGVIQDEPEKKPSKDAAGEENKVIAVTDRTVEEEKQAGQSKGEPVKDKTLEPVAPYKHSRFQEVAPGVFQFKHHRPVAAPYLPVPETYQYGHEYWGQQLQPVGKPEEEGFVRVGAFPGATKDGLPVYQFT
ncbi:hypothetical protein Psch_00350 [Pelotomaculum schinkii]|uniref:Uncharacterized protein n=1 Tax=Pelotomaculum schinkii TaxID=78350 RepID=A0A4Y7RCV2_9FIRM|nr:hypothetical protein [Pelotomaculum schinkii]TEB06818.1 hypothetical protein Psch_00350 [Pelotomaculum schinkii]